MTVQPIEVETSTTTTINHWELGRHFFDWDNVEQARFLHGMLIGFDELGAYGHLQLSYITDAAAADGTLTATRGFVERLHEFFKADE